MAELEWVAISDPLNGKLDIGAVGFVGNDIVTIVSFFDDLDPNRDGKVSWGEWVAGKMSPISMEGKAIVEVCQAAKYDTRILTRDASIVQIANQRFMAFASAMVMDGIYAAYFARGVSLAGGAVAKQITSGMVKEFMVRKGFEAVAKEAYKNSTR